MTEHEFAMLAATLKSVYQRDGFMSDSEGVAIWYELLKDIPYDQLAAAVQKYIKCEIFPADHCGSAALCQYRGW